MCTAHLLIVIEQIPPVQWRWEGRDSGLLLNCHLSKNVKVILPSIVYIADNFKRRKTEEEENLLGEVQPVGLISLSCNWVIFYNEIAKMLVQIQLNPTGVTRN